MGNDIPMGFACWHDRGDLVGLLFGLLQVLEEFLNGDRIPPVLRRSMEIQSGEFSVTSLSPVLIHGRLLHLEVKKRISGRGGLVDQVTADRLFS